MCVIGINIQSFLYLRYKHYNIWEHEKLATAKDVIPRVEEDSGSLMWWLCGTIAQCSHGDLDPFLNLNNVAHPFLSCHATLNNWSLECIHGLLVGMLNTPWSQVLRVALQ